jgi:hypothetical protein
MDKPHSALATAFAVAPDGVDDWFGDSSEAVGVAAAAKQLGVSQRALRQLMDDAVRGTSATYVSGGYNGQRFVAARSRAGRGVPWHFTFLGREATVTHRISELRVQMAEDASAAEVHRPLPLWRRLLPFWRA